MSATPAMTAEQRGIGIGMVIAAAMIAEWDDTRATEILQACGMTTADQMRAGGVDTYDIVKLQFVIQHIAVRERFDRDRRYVGFGPIDDLTVAA